MNEQDQFKPTNDEKKIARDQKLASRSVLEEMRIPVQVKLAFFWAAAMFMYIYVDIIGFYQPGLVADILVGKVWVFEITPMWMLLSLMLMTIPALMVVMSLVLPARANRFANIGLGIFHIFLAFGTAMGDIHAYYVFGSIIEASIMLMIVRIAWKWPRAQGPVQSSAEMSEGSIASM